MNDVVVLDSLIQKRTEGIQTYGFMLLRNGKTFELAPEHKYEASFAKNGSLIKIVQMQINEGKLIYGSAQLLDLPAGDYQLEIREIIDDRIHAIYPSDRALTFHIKQNNDDLPTGTVSSLTLDEFVREFKNLAKDAGDSSNPNQGGNIEASIDTDKRTITINGKSLAIPEPVDLSGLASKDDIAGLAKQTELAEYAKKNDIPSMPNMNDYVKKKELPKQPDLSNYATKDDLKTVTSNITRHGPTGFYVRRISNPDGTAKDYEHVLDNGCIIHNIGGGTMGGVGFYTKEYETNFSSYPIMSNIMSFAHGGITIEKLRNKHGIEYVYFNGNLIVENPVNDSSKWDWSNVFFNDEDRKTFNDNPGSWRTPGSTKGSSNYGVAGDSWLIKCWYEIGLLDDNEIKSFGAVKKKEG